MDNPEKLATQVTLDKEKQNKNTTQYVLDTTICKQTQRLFNKQIMMTCSVQTIKVSWTGSHYTN